MRKTAVAAPLAAAVAAMVLGAVPAGAKHSPACTSKGSRTVVATERARVFTKRATAKPNYPVTRYYACMNRYNRRFRIAEVGEPGAFASSVRPIRLAGRFVAYSTFYEGPAGGSYALIRVRDLRTGRETVRVEAGEPRDAPGSSFHEQFATPDLELRPNGSIAWIEQSFVADAVEPVYRVRRHDSWGDAVLDTGSDIGPTSLALSGSRLYWTRGGQPAGAELR